MATAKINGLKPSRKGAMVILDTPSGDVFITKEQWAFAPKGTNTVNYEVKTSWFDTAGVEHVYADGARNEFSSFPLVDEDAKLERKLELMSKYGVNAGLE